MAHWDPVFQTFRRLSGFVQGEKSKGYFQVENEPLVEALDKEWEESRQEDCDSESGENEESLEDSIYAEENDEHHQDQEEKDDEDGLRPGDTIRNFMRGGGKDTSQKDYRDQARVVEDFCRDANLAILESGNYEGSKTPIAILDDMENKPLAHYSGLWQPKPGYQGTRRPPGYQGTRRAYRSPFTHRRLLHWLRLPVSCNSIVKRREEDLTSSTDTQAPSSGSPMRTIPNIQNCLPLTGESCNDYHCLLVGDWTDRFTQLHYELVQVEYISTRRDSLSLASPNTTPDDLPSFNGSITSDS